MYANDNASVGLVASDYPGTIYTHLASYSKLLLPAASAITQLMQLIDICPSYWGPLY
jgi:hypothetical protein